MAIQDLRIYGRALAAERSRSSWSTRHAGGVAGAKPADERTDAEKNELFDWWLAAQRRAVPGCVGQGWRRCEQEQAAIKARGTIAHVMQEKQRAGEGLRPVPRRVRQAARRGRRRTRPTCLPPMPADLPRNRLGFAQWLLRPEHPLTARVTVNRFWQEVFGTGLVRTAEDFGVTGELPVASGTARLAGGRVPRGGLGREAVLQAAGHVGRPTGRRRWPRRRSWKRTRRTACCRAGRGSAWTPRWSATTPWPPAACWSPKIGGPSVKPYQPDGVWEAVAMIGSNTRDYKRDTGENLYRRSLYTFWKRAAPPASMEIFNAPSRETCTVRRERTNTPLQALVTLNDPQFVEAARHLAQTRAARGRRDGRRAGSTSSPERLLARPLAAGGAAGRAGVARRAARATTAAHADDAEAADRRRRIEARRRRSTRPTLAAWTMLANELMNLDEVLNK